ncbi:MAG: serine hydrolase domain-containing protein [Parvularculaceae bacterium]|nr:serine hydrolase domain-containing protein [Parvularculaceae bacterium]
MELDRRHFLGGAVFVASAGAQAAVGARAAQSEGGSKADRKALKAIEVYMAEHRAAWGVPGMTLAVVTRDGFSGFAQSGLADVDKGIGVAPHHLFQIGSISKMFTALTAWSLIDEGKLTPETKLETALRGMSVRGGKAITLQHLLNHTAGLPANSSIFPEGGLWSAFAPGSNWSYSNSGYDLAGKIVSSVDGRAFADAVQARVLNKLDMAQSVPALRVADRYRYAQGYEPALTDRLNPRPGAMTPSTWVESDSPAGCLAATSGDMAVFLRFLLGLAEGKGGAILSDGAAKRFLADPADGWGPGAKYGNGVAHIEVDGRRYLHHTGGMVSFCSALHVDAEAGIAAFASANVHYSLNYRPSRVTTYACEMLRALRANAPVPTPKPPRIALEAPDRFAGVFTAANGDAFDVISASGKLSLRRGGRESVLEEAAPGHFASTEPDFAVTGVAFDLVDGKAVDAWIGEMQYARNPSAGYKPAAPEALRALSGRYDNDDRWEGPLYVYARDGALWIGNAEKLTPLGKGEWRLGDETSPERIRFGGVINGRPHLLYFSGTPYVRRFS